MHPRVLVLAFLILAASSAIAARGAGAYPEATGWTPQGANVAVDSAIRIVWSMRMDSGSVEAAFTLTDGDLMTWDATAFDWTHSTSPPWMSQATPRFLFPADMGLYALVAPTARDSSGAYLLDQDRNGLGGEASDALAWTFRTENGTPPRVTETSPDEAASRVSVSDNVTIEFDEPMDAAALESAFTMDPETLGLFRWNATGTRMTFDPYFYLFCGTAYVVRLAGDIAKDANGHALDGDGDGVGGDDFTLRFTTEPDVSPPSVLSALPWPGDPNASSTGAFLLRFSEPMDRDRTEAAFTYSDGATLWDRTAGEVTWWSGPFPDDGFMFNPFANLPFNVTITARLNATVAADRAGFGLDGNGNGTAQGSPEDDFAWSFRTEMRDLTPPRVFASPPDNATEVPETTAIQLTFTEGMNRTTVEDAFTLRDPWRTWTKADGLFSWSAGDDRATFTPSTVLSFDRTYAVALGASAEDRNGNAMGTPFSSLFQTRMEPDTVPPHVVSTSPAGDAAGVSRDALISVTFDDAMDRDPTEASVSLVRLGAYTSTPVPVGDFTWDAGDHTVSFRSLASLDWEAAHRLTIGPGAKDDAGLPMGQAVVVMFTTEAWSGRVIGRVVDAEGIVPGAIVRLGDLTVRTDEDGTFAFPHASAGTYNLTVTMTGYAPFHGTVTLSHREAGVDFAQIDLGDIRMEPAEGLSALAIASGLVAAVAGLLVLAALLRRLRPPPAEPLEEVEDLEEEYAEAER